MGSPSINTLEELLVQMEIQVIPQRLSVTVYSLDDSKRKMEREKLETVMEELPELIMQIFRIIQWIQ